jgi:type II secretory pathway pseudopilin PulG
MNLKKAISLVELSIALAVIGLLLGAVVGGFSVKKSAELRGIMNDISVFQNAIEGFDSKYGQLPGDFNYAYSYWGATCAGSAGDCEGDNNSQIDLGSNTFSEAYRAWQHLNLSNFLEGGYTGVATGTQADIGVNVPAAKRNKIGYSLGYADTGEGSRNEISIGAFLAGNVNLNAALTPSEAITIDKKMDDGTPNTGFVHGVDGNDAASNCTNATATTYLIATTTLSCRLTFPVKP